MKRPLVSIVVPVYNAAVYINDTIKSVQDQTYGNWELLIVDDASSDESVKIIQSAQETDVRIKLVQFSVNQGVAHARNMGMDNAKGRFLAFLDSDDLWAPEKIEKQVNFMLQDVKRKFTFTGYQFMNEDASEFGSCVVVPGEMSGTDYLKNNLIWTTSVMIDLKAIDKQYIYMQDLSYGEDALAWISILKVVDRAYGINDILAFYRRGGPSLSSNKIKMVFKKFQLYQRMEGLSTIDAFYFFVLSTLSALRKRV